MLSKLDHVERLESKIKYLNETAWEARVQLPAVRHWLSQFEVNVDLELDEQLHALFLLSHFLYFGQSELRELLRSLYRDLFRAPMLRSIRRANNDTLDIDFINQKYSELLTQTRFLGMGNPSESGAHLLYYFRQENNLPKGRFINTHEIFNRVGGNTPVFELRDPSIENYVFIDDICGSGSQATTYSRDLIAPLKSFNGNARVFYFVLFATTSGLEYIRANSQFDDVQAVFELDETFKSLEPNSRIFSRVGTPFLRERIRATCQKYGSKIWQGHPLGYRDGQLLIGFSHNTPDNTLPIFWGDKTDSGIWVPVFRRYNKVYGS